MYLAPFHHCINVTDSIVTSTTCFYFYFFNIIHTAANTPVLLLLVLRTVSVPWHTLSVWTGSVMYVKCDFSMEDRGHFLWYCLTVSLVANLHLPQILANWVCAALLLASNWIPQLFLFNSQTSEESQCKPQQRQRERRRKRNRGQLILIRAKGN